MTEAKDFDGRVVLVTGASRGIGYATAIEAARRGAHVVAVARTVGGLEELDDDIQALGGSATLVPLDLADFGGIDRLGASVFERWGRLDALIGNAGLLGTLTPVAHIAPKEFDQVYAVNVAANYRLIRAFDLPLRQSDAGRALFISSGVGRNNRQYWGLYASTKSALEVLVKTFALENAAGTVKVNVANPGPIRTAMRAKAMPGEDPDTLKPPTALAPKLVDMVSPAFAQTAMYYNFPTDELSPM